MKCLVGNYLDAVVAPKCHARQVITEVMEQGGSQIEVIMLESCSSLNQFKIQSEKHRTEDRNTLRPGRVRAQGPHCLNAVTHARASCSPRTDLPGQAEMRPEWRGVKRVHQPLGAGHSSSLGERQGQVYQTQLQLAMTLTSTCLFPVYVWPKGSQWASPTCGRFQRKHSHPSGSATTVPC